MDDFLNFMNVDKNELAAKGENEPLNNNQEINSNNQIQSESIELVKEEFNSFLNRLNKVLL